MFHDPNPHLHLLIARDRQDRLRRQDAAARPHRDHRRERHPERAG